MGWREWGQGQGTTRSADETGSAREGLLKRDMWLRPEEWGQVGVRTSLHEEGPKNTLANR